MILVPGAYFRDEMIWRGRMIVFTRELRGPIYELGFWIGAMYLGFAASNLWPAAPLRVGAAVCRRMLFGRFEQWQEQKSVWRDIDRYFDDTYSGD